MIIERYVHSIPKKFRKWDQDYIQLISIDPGQVNFAFRIERRYHSGKIIPIAFWKQAFRFDKNITFRVSKLNGGAILNKHNGRLGG